MGTEITAIEYALAICLNQERIGIECLMIHQIGSNPERVKLDRLHMFQVRPA